MAGQINIGISKIELGDLVTGGVATTFATLGYTEEGTAQLSWDDPTETEFNVEEIDDPIYISTKEGKKKLTFKVANPDEDTLVKVFGGTKTGTGDAAVFKFPDTSVELEQSVKITPKKGMGLILTRCKITAKLSSAMGRAALMGVEVSASVMKPEKAGEATISTFRVAAVTP